MPLRYGPSGSGVKRLKSGRIQVGTTYWTATAKAVVTAQHQSHAHAVAPKSQRTTDRSGPPSTTASARPFTRSVQNVRGFVVLKPKRSSITKVDHQRSGTASSVWARPSAPRKTRPVGSGP